MTVRIRVDDDVRREVYRVLNLRDKLETGQAYIEVRHTHPHQPDGDFPAGTRGQIPNLKLAVNDFRICVAHRFVVVLDNFRPLGQPDPKRIDIDELSLIQEA